MSESPSNVEFSKKIVAGSRNYFFDIRKSSDGALYLTITEARYPKDSDKKVERSRIVVYDDKLMDFVRGFKESVEFIREKGLEV